MPPPSPSLGLLPGDASHWWDLSVDALWLERDTGKGALLGSTGYGGPYGPQADSLWSDDVLFPLAPGVRLQLTARVTDRMAIEACGWGLQQWSVGRTINADPGGGVLAYSPWLQMPWLLSRRRNG